MALYTSSGDSFDSGGGGGGGYWVLGGGCWVLGGDGIGGGSPLVFMGSAGMETERVGGLSGVVMNELFLASKGDDDTVLKDFLGNAVIRNLSRILEMSVSLKILFLTDPFSLGDGDDVSFGGRYRTKWVGGTSQ